ncbi:MAG: hypothetical protein AB8B87_13065 [Granulosicoccus sp.]
MSNRSTVRKARANSCTMVLMTGTIVLANILASMQTLAQSKRPQTGVSIATQLQEVQRGTLDGRDYLTLHIGGHEVGPSSCRSNILRMDTSSEAGAKRLEEIETIAIKAMLTGATIMVVVPLDVEQCVDGKPTFTDLYRLAPDFQ